MTEKTPMSKSITPKNRNTRVSGLRRSTNRNKTASTTPIRIVTTTPQSDGKIKVLNKTQTPVVGKNVKRQTLSANVSRPYNLALSKKVRERMTKKRLEFHLPKDADTGENIKQENHGVTKGAKNKVLETAKDSSHNENGFQSKYVSKEEYLSSADDMQKYMEQRQRHIQRVADLKKAIGTWKIGFCNALNDLQQKFQPHLSKEQILQQLHIDHQMIQYLND